MPDKVEKPDAEWRAQMTPEEFHVMREKGTERAFSGEYHDAKTPGKYMCRGCGAELFNSSEKYDSGTGWPSFWKPAAEDAIAEESDASYGMIRTEVMCAACDAHLGHLFPDGPPPTGQRYCINSLSLKLEPSDEG